MNYKRIYEKIIQRAKFRKLTCYTEKHHIIPKCLGGSNDKDNLVRLTAKEHFICHRLLVLIYPENHKLKYALWCMCKQHSSQQQRYKVTAKIYESLRKDACDVLKKRIITDEWKRKNSDAQKKLAAQPGYINKGNTKPRTKEWREKISAIMKSKGNYEQKYGIEKSKEIKQKASLKLKSKAKNPESVMKMRITKLNKGKNKSK